MPLLVYVIIFILIGFVIGLKINDKSEFDGKQVRMKLEDIPDEDFIFLAMAFGAEMERRMELHERGEMQEEKQPFEEYDGKE
jgi:hypothetical protein